MIYNIWPFQTPFPNTPSTLILSYMYILSILIPFLRDLLDLVSKFMYGFETSLKAPQLRYKSVYKVFLLMSYEYF